MVLLLGKNSYIYNMKKIAFTVLFLFLLSPFSVIAEDFSSNLDFVNHAWDGQKPITDKEFEEAINVLTEKQKKKEQKAQKRKIKKISGGGTSLHNSLEPMSEIIEQEALKKKDKDEGLLLNIPVDIVVDGKVLERGYYNVFGEKDEQGNLYFSFYQAHYFKGKVKAYSTKNDFDDENLDFVKMVPYDDSYIKIMYGSLEFNAYTYLPFLKEKE